MSFPQAVAAELGGIVASDDRASQVTSVGHKGPIAYRRVASDGQARMDLGQPYVDRQRRS